MKSIDFSDLKNASKKAMNHVTDPGSITVQAVPEHTDNDPNTVNLITEPNEE